MRAGTVIAAAGRTVEASAVLMSRRLPDRAEDCAPAAGSGEEITFLP
jgi:hypothetical protein